jgi:uncharacterized membrane protein
MKTSYIKTITWILIIIPFVYLSFIYTHLPDRVPTHFDDKGMINDWSPKWFLWIVPCTLPLLLQLLLSILPKIDPKGRMVQHSNLLQTIRFITVAFLSLLSLFLLKVSQEGSIQSIALFVMILGNYLPVVKPNYFIGIRTPWALEHEMVWRKTHQLAGKLWVLGGLILLLVSVLFYKYANTSILTVSIMLTISLLPAVASYFYWKKEHKQTSKP